MANHGSVVFRQKKSLNQGRNYFKTPSHRDNHCYLLGSERVLERLRNVRGQDDGTDKGDWKKIHSIVNSIYSYT